MPRQHLTGLQRVPIANPFRYRSVTVVGFLEDRTSLLLRYQHHLCWNTSEWELILHSLHHLCHLHYELRLAVRSIGPPGVCQNWLTHRLWVRKYLFFLIPFICLPPHSVPDFLPTSRYYKSHLQAISQTLPSPLDSHSIFPLHRIYNWTLYVSCHFRSPFW